MALTAKGTPYVVSTDLVANYPTVSSDLADHIDDKLAYNAVTINAQTGSGANAYTFVLADASEGKVVTASNAAAATYTIPPQSSVNWADGAILRIVNQGAGAVTLAGGSGVTLNGGPLVLAQYDQATIIRTASNTWTVVNSASGGLVKILDSTFTTVTAVNVNNCFSSTYENYRVIVSLTAIPSQNINFRFRASGSDNTSANYFGSYAYHIGGVWTLQRDTTGQTQFVMIPNAAIGFPTIGLAFDVIAPNTNNTYKPLNFTMQGSVNYQFSGLFGPSAPSFDGFSIYQGSGSNGLTGNLRVYGYRN